MKSKGSFLFVIISLVYIHNSRSHSSERNTLLRFRIDISVHFLCWFEFDFFFFFVDLVFDEEISVFYMFCFC